MPSVQTRVLIVEPDPLYRSALERCCADAAELNVATAVASGAAAVSATREAEPDVVVMELRLPDEAGIPLLRRLVAQFPTVPVLVLTIERDGAMAFDALAAGAVSYLTKGIDTEIIREAIVAARLGQTRISPDVQRHVAAEIRLHAVAAEVRLTAREHEVLALVASGCSSPEIGRRLYLSSTTVKTHLSRVYEKLGVCNRAAAVAQAMKRGLVEPA